MTTWGNGEGLCHRAREYYYDLLRQNDAAVPEPIARHVKACPFCQGQISRLHKALSRTENRSDSPDGRDSEEAIEALARQFGFLGESVHCSQVKPFLPDLLIPSRQIRVPTPITVHVENCPQCADDLASIRELGLRADQLNRLTRFYGRDLGRDLSRCGPARPTAAALAALSLDGADPRMLRHISCCPQCRAWVYRHRARAVADLSTRAVRIGALTCDEVSMAGLFDFVVPFGLDAAAIGRADGRRDAVVTHVRACISCMEKVQLLHRTIYAVAERADSAVCTVCRPKESEGDPCGQVEGPAYHYPLDVQILEHESSPEAIPLEPVASRGSRRATWGRRKAGPRIKTALLAAAVLAMMLLALLPQPAATGMNAGHIRRAVEQMNNVYIARFHGDNPQPSQEMWVAKDRQIVAMETDAGRTICDPKQKTVVIPGCAPYTVKLEPDGSESCTKLLNQMLGMVFAGLSEDDALSEKAPVASDRPGECWSVYECTRTRSTHAGIPVVHQWRIYLNPALQPVRIEYSQEHGGQLPPARIQTTRFEYLTSSAMDQALTARFPAE